MHFLSSLLVLQYDWVIYLPHFFFVHFFVHTYIGYAHKHTCKHIRTKKNMNAIKKNAAIKTHTSYAHTQTYIYTYAYTYFIYTYAYKYMRTLDVYIRKHTPSHTYTSNINTHT